MTYLGHCHHPIGSYQSGYAWVPGPLYFHYIKILWFCCFESSKACMFSFLFFRMPKFEPYLTDFSTPGNICQHHLLNHHHQEQIHQRHHPSLMSVTMFPHCFFSSWQLPSAPFAVLSRYWWEMIEEVLVWICLTMTVSPTKWPTWAMPCWGGKAGDQLQGLSDLADKI